MVITHTRICRYRFRRRHHQYDLIYLDLPTHIIRQQSCVLQVLEIISAVMNSRRRKIFSKPMVRTTDCIICSRSVHSYLLFELYTNLWIILRFSAGSIHSSAVSCAAGYYLLKQMCYRCSAGTWSSAGATACTKCPLGTYSLAKAASCTACVASYYSPSPTIPCAKCPAGQYSTAKAYKCLTCPVGSYVKSDQTGCIAKCPMGTYSTVNGCVPCPERARDGSFPVGAEACAIYA